MSTTNYFKYLKSLNPELESSLGPKCDLNLPYICDNCLHRVLHGKFSSWTSGNELIDSFIQETQLFSPYERYPEWVPHNYLSQIKKIGEGGFGAVFSVIKSSLEEVDKDDKTRKKVYHYRTGPCTVALKKLKGSSSVRFLSFVRDHTRSSTLFIMRFAPQGDLRRYLLRNFDNLLLPNKLENAFISDFGMCRPTDTVEAKDKVYGVISYIVPEIIRGYPYSQAGDIYSLGILLWELTFGIIAFADRSHDVNLILDICDGLRPQTCHYSPLVYNDIIKMCWDPDPSKRPSASEILISIERLCAFRRPKDDSRHPNTEYQIECGGHFFKNNSGFFEPNGYDLIKYSDKAVYISRSFSYKSLQDEIDILLVKSNRSSIVE
ncbi:kinase-like protein [Rhizophagus irregularis]|uniref:Kinase-like protein n=1 Tax=Rhizophagus irregularis TaxID=588596 RepID=A0A2N0RIN4_9GLOM|nr:kinase-like protein [Rhizophagus irregularis]